MENLNTLREEIDSADTKLLEALQERFQICARIAKWKKENQTQITDKSREKEMIDKRIEIFRSLGYDDSEFIKKLYELVVEKSKQVQKEKQQLEQ